MIRILEGTIADETDRDLTILVNGIGYLVHTTKKVTGASGSTIRLHTHLAVRETALNLYGFSTLTDLTFFELLLTIPKIGPKSALQIMDQADVTLLVESINLDDATHLSKLSGIGKKTAEKIVTTLKGKVESFTLTTTNHSNENGTYTDAFDTLITLGYSPVAIRPVLDTITDTTVNTTTSNLVKQALQKLS